MFLPVFRNSLGSAVAVVDLYRQAKRIHNNNNLMKCKPYLIKKNKFFLLIFKLL